MEKVKGESEGEKDGWVRVGYWMVRVRMGELDGESEGIGW